MDLLLAIAIVYLLWRAAIDGVDALARSIRADFKRRRAAWSAAHPGASATAHRTALVTATVWHGTGPALKAFGRGWRSGWQTGRDRVHRRFGKVPPTPAPPIPTPRAEQTPSPTPPPPKPVPAPVPAPDPEWDDDTELGGQPMLDTVAATPLPQDIPTVQALRAALLTVIDNNTPREEAAGAVHVALDQESVECEALVSAAVAMLDHDPESVGAVAAVQDAYSNLAARLNEIPAAYEALVAAARSAHDLIEAKHAALEEAHSATPEAAQRQHYQPA